MSRKKQLKIFYKLLKKVKKCREKIRTLTNEELSYLTVEFKERLKKETLDDILPEAFAAICEANTRILGKDPYDVQILGGIALHKGFLAEMNTGEGKTLVATMPLYLNALTGKGTILCPALSPGRSYLRPSRTRERGHEAVHSAERKPVHAV